MQNNQLENKDLNSMNLLEIADEIEKIYSDWLFVTDSRRQKLDKNQKRSLEKRYTELVTIYHTKSGKKTYNLKLRREAN